LVHRYPNGDVMLKQGEDLLYLEASQLIVLADFLFHRSEV
jgi:hypothetical protein